jgi:hypothetical protein
MAFTGVNRANVAVTDTFDTWRIRTNEINNTLNLAVSANTADTIMYRDNAGSANLNVLEANSAIVTHTGSTDTAFSVVSAVAAQGDGSYASIKTTGGLYATLSSKFAADLTVGTDLTVSGNTALGSSTADEVTFTSTLAGDILPTVTSGAGTITAGAATGSDLGAAANSFAHIYTVQETISATSGITTNVFSVTSAAGAGNTATLLNNSATTGTILNVLSSSTDASTRSLATITQSGDAGASGSAGVTGLSVTTTSGRGIFIDSDDADGEEAFQIDAEQTTTNTVSIDAATTTGTSLDVVASGVLVGAGKAVEIRSGTVTTGTLLSVNSTATGTGTRTLEQITTSSAAATGTTGLTVTAAAGRGVFIDTNLAAGGYSLEIDAQQTTSNTAKIDSEATSGTMLELTASGTLTGKGVNLTADSATTGTGFFMSMDGLTTGKMIDLTTTGTLVTTGRVIDITADSATTANGISVSMDALTTGSILDLSSTSTSTTARDLVKITNDAAAAVAATALSIQSDGGRGIFIDSNLAAGLPSLEIDSEHTTANSVIITSDALTSGSALDISEDSSSTTARNVVSIRQDNASATSATALHLQSDGGRGIFIDSNLAAGKPSLEIDSEHTTANTVIIASDILSTGSALQVSSTGTHSGNLVSFISDGAATGPTLHLRSDATTSTVKALQVANSSADIFSVTVGGDATIANDLTISGDFVVTGNLSVAGATSEINTTTTIVKDKTLVLGTQSAAVTSVTYTAANPPVITSTGHTLDDGDVLFVVASTGTAITSEQLIKVSANGTNVFTPTLIDDSAIAGSGDSTTRTLSYVGPQTDALVDDAGIYVPGDTAVHSFKWDDTDKYWESNASLFVNDTGQLVIPTGTTAQKPGSSVSGTVPAATTGAMRFNTTTSKFEGVTTGTTYENLSTEGFSISVAIALG